MTTRTQFIAAVRATPGWTQDRFGHFRLNIDGKRPIRLKCKKLAARLEVQGTYQDGGKFWVARASIYYGKLVTIDGQYILGGHRFGAPASQDIGI